MGRIMPRELEVREGVSAGDPGMLQNLFCCVSLVRIHVEHMGQEVLVPRQTHSQGGVTQRHLTS